MALNEFGIDEDQYEQPDYIKNFSWSNMLDWTKNTANKVKDAAIDFDTSVKESVQSGLDTVKEGASDLLGRAKEGLQNFNKNAEETRAANLAEVKEKSVINNPDFTDNNNKQQLGDGSSDEQGAVQKRNPYSGHITESSDAVTHTVDANTTKPSQIVSETLQKTVDEGYNDQQMQIPQGQYGETPIGVRPDENDAVVQNQVNKQEKGQNTNNPFGNWSLGNIGSYKKEARTDETEFLEDGRENPNFGKFIEAGGEIQYDEDEGLGLGGKVGGFMSKFGTGEGFLSQLGKGREGERKTKTVEADDAFQYKNIFQGPVGRM